MPLGTRIGCGLVALLAVVFVVVIFAMMGHSGGSPVGAIGGSLFLISMLAAVVAYIVALVLILAWVAKDARNRGVDGGAVWVIVMLFLHVIGLLVYLASRPHGILVLCPTCGNKKLAHALTCPHCGR